MNRTKSMITGLSVALVLGLSACGTNTDTGAKLDEASVNQALSQLNVPLETRQAPGTTFENPTNLIVESVTADSVTISFDGFKDAFGNFDGYQDAEGVAFAYAPITEAEYGDDYNISTQDPAELEKSFWKKAQFGWGVKTTVLYAADGETIVDANRTSLTVNELDPNTRYAFRIASFMTQTADFGSPSVKIPTTLEMYSGTGSWSEITTQAKTLAIIENVECLEGCCSSWCDPETGEWVYGAKLSWQLPEGITKVNIYRTEISPADDSVVVAEALLASGVEGTEYLDASAESGKKYIYRVVSVDDEGHEATGKTVTVGMY